MRGAVRGAATAQQLNDVKSALFTEAMGDKTIWCDCRAATQVNGQKMNCPNCFGQFLYKNALKCKDFILFFLIHDLKMNICGIVIRPNKIFEDVTLGMVNRKRAFFKFIVKIINSFTEEMYSDNNY